MREPPLITLRNTVMLNAKYLRKFVFDKMIDLEVPESVADFIEAVFPNGSELNIIWLWPGKQANSIRDTANMWKS